MEERVDVNLKNVKINDPFWSKIQNLVTDVVIPYQERILNDEIPGVEKSHAIANFRIAAGEEVGEFYGMVFQDSDVAKWLEAVAYSLAVKPDPELETRADEVIDIIGKAQGEDGYLNTFFTIKEPEHRWQNLLECHELYCAGHMMEAAVAYYEVTGKDKLLHIMEGMADHIDSRFGVDKERGIPGHEEIEIGLMRMYYATGKEKYRDLAQYFIDERGQNPDYFKEEITKRDWVHWNMNADDGKYAQYFAPVREQKTAEGHSVRAVYLYTAMASLAKEIGDDSLFKACDTIWDNIVNKRMYITGGIGSTAAGEAFTIDYDLPNDSIYAETCASIGLIFFAKKMLDIKPSNRYADVMELALYNGVISGMQLDGKNFFYVNPLEVNPEVSGKLAGYKHVLPQRPGWYACACCPPNVARLITSLGKYAWSEDKNTIFSHLYIGGDAKLNKADIKVESGYPWDGTVTYTIHPKTKDNFTFALRIPNWSKNSIVLINNSEVDMSGLVNGYLYLNRAWEDGDKVSLILDMSVRKMYANTAVRADAGCVAFMRGPVVYCFEGVDNGEELQALRIPREVVATLGKDDELLHGLVTLQLDGIRLVSSDELYSENPPREEKSILTAIPYFAWGNRGLNGMRVWMIEK